MIDILSKNKKFASAADYCANNVSSFSNEELLDLYGFYKQATVGDAPEKSGSFFSVFSVKDQAKSKSWASRKGMSPEDAANEYIKLIDKKNPHWEETIGKNSCFSLSNSTSRPLLESNLDEEKLEVELKSVLDQVLLGPNFSRKDCSLSVFDAFCSQVNKNETEFLKKVLEKYPFLSDSRSSQGSHALHLACDKGYSEIALLLLKSGANPNAKDNFGDSPLHIAVISEQESCIKILLEYGADVTLTNDDGLTPIQVSESAQIKRILENN
ncbi:acyl-binding protein [Cryptosporidium sp. chipmunk genotype I]|uniref:acyl-binding protein n=1 Tax=Cryptosporidium sp. chipmunk genotype I TaxID=1280935 RepID=UPI003519E67C|nr:acyl-binding protein [Cryptosporidium sp. chipmunk genotype I]